MLTDRSHQVFFLQNRCDQLVFTPPFFRVVLQIPGQCIWHPASGKKFCVRTLNTQLKHLDARNANWQGIHRSDDACQHPCLSKREMPVHMRTRRRWPAQWPSRQLMSRQMSSRRRVPWHPSSGQGVPGYLPSGPSVWLTDTECQRKYRPDDALHGMSSGRHVPQHLPSRRGVSGHFPSGRRLLRQMSSERRASQQLPSGRRMPPHLRSESGVSGYLPSARGVSGHPSPGQGVSGHLPSGCSVRLTEAECQGKCRLDNARHSICLLDIAQGLQT